MITCFLLGIVGIFLCGFFAAHKKPWHTAVYAATGLYFLIAALGYANAI